MSLSTEVCILEEIIWGDGWFWLVLVSWLVGSLVGSLVLVRWLVLVKHRKVQSFFVFFFICCASSKNRFLACYFTYVYSG